MAVLHNTHKPTPARSRRDGHACGGPLEFSPVLAVGVRQLLPEMLQAEAVAGGVQTEAAGADDGGRRRAGLEQVVPLAHGAQDGVGLWAGRAVCGRETRQAGGESITALYSLDKITSPRESLDKMPSRAKTCKSADKRR